MRPAGAPATYVEGARRRRAGTGVLCLTLLGLTAGAVGHVAVQSKHLEVAGQIGKEEAERQRLVEERQKLQVTVQRLRRSGAIEQVAREKLHMGPPALEAIRRLPR